MVDGDEPFKIVSVFGKYWGSFIPTAS